MPGAPNGKLPFQITRKQFEELIAGYVNRCIEVTRQCLATANVDVRQVNEILCVGGSTRIPLVRQRLGELFKREPNTKINPDEVVAQGAAIQAGSLVNNLSSGTGMGARDGRRDAGALDARGHGRRAVAATRGGAAGAARRESRDARDPHGGRLHRALARQENAPIPIERTRVFTTSRDNQTRVEIDCCRGEARRYTENEPLGTLVLENLPSKPRGDLKIEVSFRVDSDGILHVRAADQQSGVRQEAHLQVLGAPMAAEE